MKKILALLLIALLMLSMSGCKETDNDSDETVEAEPYASVDDVTVDSLNEMSVPSRIVNQTGGFSAEMKYSGSNDELLNSGKEKIVFLKKDGIIHCNQMMDFEDGTYSHVYFSNDSGDKAVYTATEEYSLADAVTSDYLETIDSSILGYDVYSTVKLNKVEEVDGMYVAYVDILDGEELVRQDEVTVDPQTRLIRELVTRYIEDGEAGIERVMSFSYEDIQIDDSPKTGQESSEAVTGDEVKDFAKGDRIEFDTVDINGNKYSNENIKDAKLVMMNFWEPYCKPCIAEMPDLQALYEKYKDKGFVVLGIYASEGMDEDANAIVKDTGVKYPILKADSGFAKLGIRNVPTTYFTDGEGNILSDEPVVGSRSEKEWEEMISEYLK